MGTTTFLVYQKPPAADPTKLGRTPRPIAARVIPARQLARFSAAMLLSIPELTVVKAWQPWSS
jgi:hypothetical protein